MQSLSAIRSDLLALKWHVAASRFRQAMRRHAWALKAGFDPNQPRAPAGYADGGQWTDAGGGGGTYGAPPHAVSDALSPADVSAARRRPPHWPIIEAASHIPDAQPKTQRERNYVAQQVAKNLRVAQHYLSEMATSASHWLNEKYWEIRSYQDPPKSLGELHDAVFRNDKRGYDVHHIVERTPARNDNHPDGLINREDNLVLIPRYKHWQINAWFETPNDDLGGLTPRKYLIKQSWDERRRVGLIGLRKHGVLKP